MVSNGGTLQDTTHSAVFSSGSQVKFALSGTYDIARIGCFLSSLPVPASENVAMMQD
jgi:hypothetical protein